MPVLSQNVRHLLQRYDYPGNVRQLQNAMGRAAIFCNGQTIKLAHLPREISPDVCSTSPELDESERGHAFRDAKSKAIEAFERKYLLRVMEESGGVICRAAELADMHEKNFHAKLTKYDIHAYKSKSAYAV